MPCARARRPSASTASPRRTPTSPPGRRRMAPGSTSARCWSPGPGGPEDHLTVRAPDGHDRRRALRHRFVLLRTRVRHWWRRGSGLGRDARRSRAGEERKVRSTRGRCRSTPFRPRAHPGAVAVPLPILAVDAGQRGLYRAAAHRRRALALGGAGRRRRRARLRPRRAGRRRASAIGRRPRCATGRPQRLAGTIERFSAIWGRLLDAWFSGEGYPQLDDEKQRGPRLLLERLGPREAACSTLYRWRLHQPGAVWAAGSWKSGR